MPWRGTYLLHKKVGLIDNIKPFVKTSGGDGIPSIRLTLSKRLGIFHTGPESRD